MPVLDDSRPFTSAAQCIAVLPDQPADEHKRKAWFNFTMLIQRETPELEAELGTRIAWSESGIDHCNGARMLIGPARLNPDLAAWQRQRSVSLPKEPLVAIDRPERVVVMDAPSLDDIGDAFQLLRTAIWQREDLLTASFASSPAELLQRLDNEVQRTFPQLFARVPGWKSHVESGRRQLKDPDDLATIQTLMAHLQDAHSWAKDPRINGRLPYHTMATKDGCHFWDVPSWSHAWAAGVRSGDLLLEPRATDWLVRTGATLHAKPWVIGYRMLAGRVGEAIELEARRAAGGIVRWAETIPSTPWHDPIEWKRLDRGTGYLRIHAWLNSDEWHDAFITALQELGGCDRLVVDLRGNVGGALVAAQDARDRFLPGETHLGTIRFSTITGEIDAGAPLTGRPPATGPVWTKSVRFVTDPLCYSATEDFLLGLQGLPHVHVIGQTTGGGSGRPRTISLRPNLNITISTALTFDRQGRCIEGNGLVPDVPIVPDAADPGAGLRRATAGW